MVDSAGGDASDCGSGAYDPYSRPHDRDDQQSAARREKIDDGDRHESRLLKSSPIELGLTPERVREIYKIAQHPISLQAEVGDGGESQFGDFLEDTAIESPAEATGYSILKDKMNEVLATLTDRERTVLIERFGLLDGKAQDA